jgi:hypothetical protein
MDADVSYSRHSGLDDLAAVALEGLPRMIDPSTRLFAHKATVGPSGLTLSRPNLLYTAISLIGLIQDQGITAGLDRLPDAEETVAAMARSAETTSDVVSLGAVTWALALLGDERCVALAKQLVDVVPEGTSSMGLGVALSGLAARSSAFEADPSVLGAAKTMAGELTRRLDPRVGLFAATSGRLTTRGLPYRRLTSFASQVYPLHGLAMTAARSLLD